MDVLRAISEKINRLHALPKTDFIEGQIHAFSCVSVYIGSCGKAFTVRAVVDGQKRSDFLVFSDTQSHAEEIVRNRLRPYSKKGEITMKIKEIPWSKRNMDTLFEI